MAFVFYGYNEVYNVFNGIILYKGFSQFIAIGAQAGRKIGIDGCKIFTVVKQQWVCPYCNENNWEMLGGKEFYIKEILCC